MRRVFSDVHAAGENDQIYFLPAGKKLCEAFCFMTGAAYRLPAVLFLRGGEPVYHTAVFIRSGFKQLPAAIDRTLAKQLRKL